MKFKKFKKFLCLFVIAVLILTSHLIWADFSVGLSGKLVDKSKALVRAVSEKLELEVVEDSETNALIIGETQALEQATRNQLTSDYDSANQTSYFSPEVINSFVKYVVDGDTIVIDYEGSEERLRFIGIDAPELTNPNQPQEGPGSESYLFTKEMLEGKEVYIELDIAERDPYGRLLGYVWLDNDVLFNQLIVEEGLAKAVAYPPNLKYNLLLHLTQLVAQENDAGLWHNYNFVIEDVSGIPITPLVNTGDESGQAEGPFDDLTESPYPDRLIKGNINRKGEKIYHCPGQSDYNRTVIDESKGERWFATEEEAVAAGWRRAKR